MDQKPKLKELTTIVRIQEELYNLSFSINFDNRDQVVELLHVHIL